jgi:putative hydrolase of the HAD superfamily
MRTLRAVTLDLDDTLWPIRPAIERAESALHAWLVRHAPEAARRYDIEALRLLRDEVARDRPEWALDFTRVRHFSISLALQRSGHDPALADAAFEAFFSVRHQLALFPEAEAALQALSARFPLLAVTNGNADLSRLPIARHFQGTVSARELGIGKPDRRIFEAACERLGCEPHEVIHVGDDWQLDVEGALAAGLCAAWLRRDGVDVPAEPREEAERLWIVGDLATFAQRLLHLS